MITENRNYNNKIDISKKLFIKSQKRPPAHFSNNKTQLLTTYSMSIMIGCLPKVLES